MNMFAPHNPPWPCAAAAMADASIAALKRVAVSSGSDRMTGTPFTHAHSLLDQQARILA